MSNLLPEKNKKDILKEFFLRLIIVFFSLFFSLMCVAVVLLIPSYILSQVKEIGANDETKIFKQVSDFRKTETPFDLLEKEKMKIYLLKESDNFSVDDIIEIIINKKNSDIKITGIFYDNVSKNKDDSNYSHLVIKGVANKRSALINFVDGLKQENYFSNIDLPVSNLVKDESVDFSLNINVSKDI